MERAAREYAVAKRVLPIVHEKIEKPNVLMELLMKEQPEVVVHLAAQAGVRYSIENPRAYLESNINDFELLEARAHPPKHMLLALPLLHTVLMRTFYKETVKVDHQMSFYAATKKSTENMAHSYAHLFGLLLQCSAFSQCMVRGDGRIWRCLSSRKPF